MKNLRINLSTNYVQDMAELVPMQKQQEGLENRRLKTSKNSRQHLETDPQKLESLKREDAFVKENFSLSGIKTTSPQQELKKKRELEYAKLLHEKFKQNGSFWRALSPEQELKINLYEAEHGISSNKQRRAIYLRNSEEVHFAEYMEQIRIEEDLR